MRTDCRVCHGKNLQKVLNLGASPLANAFLEKHQITNWENFYPLELSFCEDCTFVQLGEVVHPDILFKDYLYVSSTSPVFVKHFEDLADFVCDTYDLPQESLVVDVGSNDGILLKPFKAKGLRVLGVEPALKIALMAEKAGIETLPSYFDLQTSNQIRKVYGEAKLITATSVFPHIDDLDEFLASVKNLLADDGYFLIEAYFLGSLISGNLFDTIYHEHLSYFSCRTITDVLERHGFKVLHIGMTDTHGGSLRVVSRKAKSEMELKREYPIKEGYSLDKIETYSAFSRRINQIGMQLLALLKQQKKLGFKIVGYGAPAKSTTLLNYFDIGPDMLDYIVDDSPLKQGLYSPGKHIPIVSSAELQSKQPDYVLILAWNFAEPIMKKLRENGYTGKFILPLPEPKIVD